MASMKGFLKGAGNVAYNTAVITPLSVVMGASWLHLLPSYGNARTLYEDKGFVKGDGDDGGVRATKLDVEMTEKFPITYQAIENHPFNRLGQSFGKLSRSSSTVEEVLSFFPMFLGVMGGIFGTVGLYGEAVSRYGWKALTPLAVTNGLSLLHEIRFNRKLNKLEEKVNKK